MADIPVGGSPAGIPAIPLAHFCRGWRREIFQPSGPDNVVDGAPRDAPRVPPRSKRARPPALRIGRVDRTMTADIPAGGKPAGTPAKPSAHR
jgi:hypothetical protein